MIGKRTLCGLFGKTRQAYYEASWRENKELNQQELVLSEVKRIRKELPRVGTEKLFFLLAAFFHQHHIKMGRDKLYALLRRHNLLLKRTRRSVITTNSNHPFYKYPNLTNDLAVSKPNVLWVSDMTYIRIPGGFAYLSLITDAYSKKIVGWSLQETMQGKGPLQALQMALKDTKGDLKGLIHHSDRGLQYCAREYIKELKKNAIQVSMTHNGDPGENAIAERVNGTIKNEFYCRGFLSVQAAQTGLQQAIHAYNQLRPHASCNYLTPVLAHQTQGPLEKKWKKPDRKYLASVPDPICTMHPTNHA